MWKNPYVFIILPTGETKEISKLPDTPDQEEDLIPQDNDVDPEDDDPSFLDFMDSTYMKRQYEELPTASTLHSGSPENKDLIYSSFVLRDSGLSPIGTPTYEQWLEVGRFIKKAAHASTLWLGYWINFGKIKYGGKYERALQETGLDYGTLKNAAYTARNVELSDRSDNLSYKHHELVAPLPKSQQRQLLREAERKKYSTRELQQRIHDLKKLQFSTPKIPEGIFSVIYADPPWEIESLILTRWRTPLPYPTMTLSELKTMQLPQMAEDAILFLWTTLSTLPHGLELLSVWGFLYHIIITWDKQYLRHLGRVACLVNPPQLSDLGNCLIYKNRLWDFRK